jgi:hypothetical protein
MIIPTKFHQNYERGSIKNTNTPFKIRLVRPEVVIGPTETKDLRKEDRFFDCDQENGFFKGLLIMFPCSVLLWILAVWGVRSLIY